MVKSVSIMTDGRWERNQRKIPSVSILYKTFYHESIMKKMVLYLLFLSVNYHLHPLLELSCVADIRTQIVKDFY